MGLRALRRVYFLGAEVTPSESRRTVAFVDGQNLYHLYHAARKAFGYSYPNYDAQALASAICARQGWSLVQARFYTGLHDAWRRRRIYRSSGPERRSTQLVAPLKATLYDDYASTEDKPRTVKGAAMTDLAAHLAGST
jgi:hypothetical protein